ncbi:1,4-beta-glucanase [Porcipelethomonas sp.]|uniref:1,4-beta-glucanase n=1 Tax=Porcipelethomonas sp. TaxID=2981675 RepID=UPI003EFAABEB
MNIKTKILSFATSCALIFTASAGLDTSVMFAETSEDVTNTMDWGAVEIGGGGFVSGIVTGQNEMYLRTDVGGAYKYNYETGRWDQLFAFINEADRGLLSVKGIAIDPTDDDTAYFLCGCAYFSDARTVIFKTTDGGKTFEEVDVTDLIQVHGNGDGRECSEPIAVDPDNPDTIYAGGDVTAGDSALIKSTDGGKTWKAVKGYDDLGMYTNDIKWPLWTDHITRATTSGEYNTQNGVATIHIEDGKVYVGTSVTGQTNIHVADVETDEFTELSADLPTANYPLTISSDYNGNIFVTYIAGLAFSGGAGGAYKYNIASGTVTDISPSGNAIGMITADKSDPDKLLARTCGLWSDQWYEKEWTDGSIAWGDHFFRSEDGGATWTDITPGQQVGQYTDNHYFLSEPIDTNGYDWIYGKAIHWGSGIVIDPRNSDKILLTSGNGVFACDNTWADKGVQFYFDPAGIEEVVALDMTSVPDGAVYSAIGDYDGFVHTDVNEIPAQHKPNMGSTGAIAYCPQNPDVMVRFAENEGKGYYTTDGGTAWTEMANAGGSGGKAAITQLEDGSYRIFHTSSGGKVNYSDDFGDSWSECSGTKGSKVPGILVEPDKPNIVYVYTAQYNDYWFYDTTKTEPTYEDANYQLMVSTDYGATFTSADICKYDQCDVANRIAYLGEGQIVLGAGWNGAYISTDYGKTVTKLDNVFYCKTIGYGAPEKEGDVNTLYMYGKPQESDPEGIYRSQDSGETWVLINKDNLYGGTGNGNFLVGDMNEFGTVYMSTVGCGIIYGRLASEPKPEPTETTAVTSVSTTTTTKVTSVSTELTTDETTDETIDPSSLIYGDVNLDKSVTSTDVVLLNKYLLSPTEYPLDREQAYLQANCCYDFDDDGNAIIDLTDSTYVCNVVLGVYVQSDLGPQE